MDREFFVISEGTTDFEVLKLVVSQCGAELGLKYKAKALWPGDRYAQRAGWASMKNWCLEQASALAGNNQRYRAAATINPKLAVANFQRPAADKIGAALSIAAAGHQRRLVLQIDADIAHHLLGESVANAALSQPLSLADRKVACENALNAWLGGHAEKVGISIIFCISTLALETWILASHHQGDLNASCGVSFLVCDYDHLVGPDELLLKLGYASNGPQGAKKLRKSVGLYSSYGSKLIASLADARERSSSLRGFCDAVHV